jgi:hypothetical protein
VTYNDWAALVVGVFVFGVVCVEWGRSQGYVSDKQHTPLLGIVTISAFVGFVAAVMVWAGIQLVLISAGKVGGAQ